MECIYFFIEVIVFIVASINLKVEEEASNREYIFPFGYIGYIQNNHSSQISVNSFNQNNRNNKNNQSKINLKLKDDKNNRYEIEIDKKSNLKTLLDKLKKKYESLIEKNITSLNIGNRDIIINKTNLSKTLEELNLVDYSGFIIINIEEKLKLMMIKRLKCCLYNLDNIERAINIKENNTFSSALNNLKKNYDLNSNIYFDPIFYYEQNQKIKITNDMTKKEIFKLNLPDYIIIYMKLNYKDKIIIKFILENNNNKKYKFKAGIKEKFHSVAINFMKTSEEFLDNIIYAFFIKQKNNNKKIIETETVYCFDTLDKMDLIKYKEIYFETRKDKNILPKEILKFNNENFDKNRYINLIFKNSLTIQSYPITADLDETFEEILFRLKREYNIFRTMKTALYQGNSLDLEEKRELKIRYLIKYGQYDILIMLE